MVDLSQPSSVSRPRVIRAALGAAACCLVACSAEIAPNVFDSPEVAVPAFEELKSDEPRLAPTASGDAVRVLASNNLAFAFDLLDAIEPAENSFFSPHSISVALAMLYAGAGGRTKREMAKVLHFEQSDSELHQAFNTLDQILGSRGAGAAGADGQGFRLRISNALWGQHDYPFHSSYIDVLGQHYGAGLKLLDFVDAPNSARETINLWVSDETEGRIPHLLAEDSVNTNTRFVLTNTVYFNAAWVEPFPAYETQQESFARLDGSTVLASIMNDEQSLRYAEGDGWKAVELGYDGGELGFLAILPDTGTFSRFERSLDPSKLEDLISALSVRKVRLKLPRFQLRQKLCLKETLAALGMPTAFSPGADLSGVSGETLSIQDVIHEGFAKVDEAGTEAAAATAVTTGGIVMSFKTRPPKYFEATRPFLFVIRDRETGAVLFVGRVVDPTAD